MRALVIDRPASIEGSPLRLVERPPPEPGPGELRLRVHACGICRTDLHVIEGDLPLERSPLVPGHQVVGVVDRLGPGASRFVLGERVGAAWLRSTCGRCPDCLRGDENLCRRSRYTGWHEDGGYAEAMVVPQDFAYRIPAVFSDLDAAPLLCAGIIGFRALRRSELPPGGRLGLYGFGSSAHLVLQIARERGCQVLVATRGERHRRLATELGAAWVGDTFDPPPAALDGAIVFAPAGEVVPPALRALRPGGTAVLAGIHMSDIPAISYEPHLFHEKRLTSVEANTRRDAEELLAEAARIGLRPRVQVFPFLEANHALAQLKRDAIEGTGVLVMEARG